MNPRSPYVLDTRELGRRPGTRREYRREVEAPEQLGLDMIGVPNGAPLVVAVALESVSEGVLVTGSITGELVGVCGRCLIDFTEPLDVGLMELFAYPNSTTEETTDSDEIPRLSGDHLDLEPVVRDTVVLSLPLTPLCRPDCAGLCQDCGERLDELPEDHSHVRLDPRWAALAERFDTAAGPVAGPADSTHSSEGTSLALPIQSQE
ncbi:MAG: YceD family protein [Jatrophihabitans sp.]